MTRQVVHLTGIVLLGAALAMTGCKARTSKTASKPAVGAGGAQEIASTTPLGMGSSIDVGQRPLGGAGQFREGMFQPVLFGFDSAQIRPTEIPKLETVALHLKSNGGSLVVEGHCDERGTAEYNRALGERRALAAREILIQLGVSGSRISTISYGEDRPAVTGSGEDVWAQNRRAEFVVVLNQ